MKSAVVFAVFFRFIISAIMIRNMYRLLSICFSSFVTAVCQRADPKQRKLLRRQSAVMVTEQAEFEFKYGREDVKKIFSSFPFLFFFFRLYIFILFFCQMIVAELLALCDFAFLFLVFQKTSPPAEVCTKHPKKETICLYLHFVLFCNCIF